MSVDTETVLLLSRRTGFVGSLAPIDSNGDPSDEFVQSAYVGNPDDGVWMQLNAAENGVPGVIADYQHPTGGRNDWIEADLSGDGLRAVFSTIQYGIVDDPALPCRDRHPRHIYVWDCRH
jgi:hypothetical protein